MKKQMPGMFYDIHSESLQNSTKLVFRACGMGLQQYVRTAA
jgi:hypothetical protein